MHKIGGAHIQCVNKSLELHITKTRNPKSVVDRRTDELTNGQTNRQSGPLLDLLALKAMQVIIITSQNT